MLSRQTRQTVSSFLAAPFFTFGHRLERRYTICCKIFAMATLSAQSSTRTDENASARMQGKGEAQQRKKSSRKAFGELTNNVPVKGSSIGGKPTQQVRPKTSQSSSRRRRAVDLDFDNLPEVESMAPYMEPIHEPIPARYRGLFDKMDEEDTSLATRQSLEEPPCKWEKFPTVPNSGYSFVLPELRTDKGAGDQLDFSTPKPHEMVDFAASKSPMDSLCASKSSVNDDLDRFFVEMGFV